MATPRHAAGEAEHAAPGHVDRQHVADEAPDALQDGDAAHLLLHEHARHARDADAAENQHDEADQAQVVLGPLEILADVVLDLPVAADADELVAEVAPTARGRSRRRLRRTRHLQQQLT